MHSKNSEWVSGIEQNARQNTQNWRNATFKLHYMMYTQFEETCNKFINWRIWEHWRNVQQAKKSEHIFIFNCPKKKLNVWNLCLNPTSIKNEFFFFGKSHKSMANRVAHLSLHTHSTPVRAYEESLFNS